MDFSTAGRSHFLVILLVLVGVTACGERVGPSDEKVKLDIEETMLRRMAFFGHGVAEIDTVVINRREVLAEDRVKFHVTLSLKANEEAVREYVQIRSGYPRGALAPPPDAEREITHMITTINGKPPEQFSRLYRLKSNCLWEAEADYPGHE